MPYIKSEDRKKLADGGTSTTAGELNYAFTVLAKAYIIKNGLSYQKINDVLGAFDGASKEFYRRVAEPYENLKIKENGDVY